MHLFVFAFLLSTVDPSAELVRASARDYRAWGRVDDTVRVAPELCKMPSHPDETPRLSTSGPHGQKLFYLWASDKRAYNTLGDEPAPCIGVGFTVVKEAFGTPPPGSSALVGPAKGLYLMTKLEDRWLFGTIAPDGRVTSAGALAACKGCHDRAPHDGLFGLR